MRSIKKILKNVRAGPDRFFMYVLTLYVKKLHKYLS